MDDTNDNTNDSTSSTDDKTYHFRKGSDLDGFESFGALFADGLFTDLAICCSGRIFRCHRVVMAASSAYIKNALSAFQTSDHQNNCNTIMILPQDIKVQDMEAILHFIYNGQVEVTRDAIESFLSSAKILHIKGLANIKLVYNNSNHNQKTSSATNCQPLNHTMNTSVANNTTNTMNNSNQMNNIKQNLVKNMSKTVNNENQNSQNFHTNSYINNNCNNNENNSSNTNSNTANNSSSAKRRNGIIGGQTAANRSPKLKTDLNFNHTFVDNIPQNQSFHSSASSTPPPPLLQTPPHELEAKSNHVSARRKQKVSTKTSPPQPLPATNGFVAKETNGEKTNKWVTIDDEEELTQESMATDENKLVIDPKSSPMKMEALKDTIEKSVSEEANGADDSSPAMPCLIQIDADPTTFPSFCSENADQKSAKRRRSSSLRLEKHSKSGHSLVKSHRNGDHMKQMVRSSNRKLGYIAFHKKASSTNIWNSSNKWKCEICNKLYGNKQTLKEHMDYFHSNRAEQIYTCSICAKEYTWKKSLMKHYRDIHQITNTSLSQLVATTPSSKESDVSTDAIPALEWVTQSQDNSSQSK